MAETEVVVADWLARSIATDERGFRPQPNDPLHYKQSKFAQRARICVTSLSSLTALALRLFRLTTDERR